MPFAPRSFGTGRPSLIKPSSAAMQQFRRGSPSVAPVPLRMPARPPVANRMQQYNTPPQMPPDRGGPFVPPPMPREMPTPPGGGGVMKMPETGGLEPNPGGYGGGRGTFPETGGLEPNPGGNELASTGQQGMPKYDPRGMGGGEMSQPGGGGVMIMNPDESFRPYGTPAPGGNELSSTGQQGMPKYDPRGMPGGGATNPDGSPLDRTMGAFKRGGQVQAYAKGGRVMAKPVAKKAVKAAAPTKTASRGDGIAQRGRTKGTMR